METDQQSIRDKLNKISNAMKDLGLETVKLALMQSDLCEVKKENIVFKAELSEVKKENTILKAELFEVKKENIIQKEEINTLKKDITESKDSVLAKLSELGQENTDLKKIVGTLRNDFDIMKSTFMSKAGQCSNEEKSADETKEPVDNKEADSAGTTNETHDAQKEQKGTNSTDDKALTVGKKSKTQRKREQTEMFRNWRKTMTQRKTAEDLWASGLLKVTMELWEDGAASMDGDQISDFVQRNVEQLITFITSHESKKRFFLTFIKMCSMRNVAKPKFEEIMLCFVNRGPKRNMITESEMKEFNEIYK